MKLRELMFSTFLGMAKLLWGKNLGKLPLVRRVYDFSFKHLRPVEIDLIEVEGNRMYINPGDVDVRLTHGASLYCDPHDKLLTPLFRSEIKKTES